MSFYDVTMPLPRVGVLATVDVVLHCPKSACSCLRNSAIKTSDGTTIRSCELIDGGGYRAPQPKPRQSIFFAWLPVGVNYNKPAR